MANVGSFKRCHVIVIYNLKVVFGHYVNATPETTANNKVFTVLP
jgi:hypothetical protein